MCTEIIATIVLLIHYWRAGLRSYAKEKHERLLTTASTSSSGGSKPSTSSGLSVTESGYSGRDEPTDSGITLVAEDRDDGDMNVVDL